METLLSILLEGQMKLLLFSSSKIRKMLLVFFTA